MSDNKLLIEQLTVQLREAQAVNRHLRKALEFYADQANWYIGDSFKQSCRISETDLEYFAKNKTSDLIGGKKARQFLNDISDVKNLDQIQLDSQAHEPNEFVGTGLPLKTGKK